jgi:hypothetical protein
MLKKFFVTAIMGVGLLIPMSASEAVVKPGATCEKIGIRAIVSPYTFTCIKSGKKLLWGNKVLSSRIIEKSDVVLQGSPIEKSIQQIIYDVKLDTTLPPVPINYAIENGPNGVLPEVSKRSATYALDFFRSAGFQISMKSYNIILGRTNDFMHSELAKNGCYDPMTDIQSGGYYGYCDTDRSGVIVDPTLLYGRAYSTDPTNSDLGIFSPTENAIYNWESILPHEIYHSTQSDWQDGTGRKSFVTGKTPIWFKESVPQLLAFMSVAKMENRQFAYVVNTYIGDRGSCTTGIRELKRYCEYTEGISAAEFLVAKFGGLDAIRQIQQKELTSSFADAFQMVTKSSLEDFYTNVDRYLAEEGWIK